MTAGHRNWCRRVWRYAFAIRGDLLVAAILLCADIVMTGSRLFSNGLCPLWFLISVLLTLVRRPGWWVGSAQVLLPLLTLLLSLANFSLQMSFAMHNAEQVVRACESYREASGDYPDRLEQLIPRYLKSIPRAKYCLWQCEFEYDVDEEDRSHKLSWHPYPGAFRWFYNFERHRWSLLD